MLQLNVIILAAGAGTRMKSSLPKAMHLLGNSPLIDHSLHCVTQLQPTEIITVINESMKELAQYIKNTSSATVVYQAKQLGSAHAVLSAEPAIKNFDGITIIMYADTPLVKPQKLQELVNLIQSNKADLGVLAFEKQDPNNYGKLVVQQSKVVSIVEAAEITKKEYLPLCNSGIMAFNNRKVWSLLRQIDNKNSKQEYYLTDLVKIANKNNLLCKYVIDSEENLQGANSKWELAILEAVFQKQKRYEFLQQGVQLIDPQTVYFSLDTKIAQDVIIYPNVYILPKVTIGAGTSILPFSVLEGAIIGANCNIGPFARLRPETTLAANNKVGNFVEIKKSSINAGVKINHLTYIGDCEIGENTNIGAGTITCNYDGNKKHATKIGADSFIGSNTALVAPITIGTNVTVGAGSVLTKDVPDDNLAIARSSQKNIANWKPVKK